MGGVAALAILGALLYIFGFRRRRHNEQKSEVTAQGWGKPELSTHASVHKKNIPSVQEMHEDGLPFEKDGNGVAEAPSGVPAAVFELPSSNRQVHAGSS